MKLGIMQPYFFPYLGYFSLIKATDRWVVFDDVQFIRHGWIERNRVLNSSDGWQYIKVPLVKAPRETTIKNSLIRNTENWQDKILAQLTCYKNKAPYYKQVIDILAAVFKEKHVDITSLNVSSLIAVCDYLQISFKYDIFSAMGIDFSSLVKKPGEWALHISKYCGANEYINPHGG